MNQKTVLPDELLELNEAPDFSVERLGPERAYNLVLLIRSGRRSYVYKAFINRRSILSRLRFALMGNMGMTNEIQVYRSAQEASFEHFRLPSLIKTDGRSYLAIELVHGDHLKSGEEVDARAERLAAALYEFQKHRFDVDHQHFLFRFRNNSGMILDLFSQAYRLARKGVEKKLIARALAIGIRSAMRSGRSEMQVACHNDLHRRNILFGADDEIYVIDLAKVAYTDKWLLRDIIDYSYGYNGGRYLHDGLFKSYLKVVSSKDRMLDGISVNDQLRSLMMKKLMFTINYSLDKGKDPSRALAFLQHTLCDDAGYEQWFTSVTEDD